MLAGHGSLGYREVRTKVYQGDVLPERSCLGHSIRHPAAGVNIAKNPLVALGNGPPAPGMPSVDVDEIRVLRKRLREPHAIARVPSGFQTRHQSPDCCLIARREPSGACFVPWFQCYSHHFSLLLEITRRSGAQWLSRESDL